MNTFLVALPGFVSGPAGSSFCQPPRFWCLRPAQGGKSVRFSRLLPTHANLRSLLGFLRKLFRRDPPLIRTRSTGRARTYSADSGYVYQYAFVGFRRVRRNKDTFIEYVWDVTGGRAKPTPVAVLIAENRLAEWTGRGRELTASERYGIAKVCLKRALDRFPDPRAVETQVIPGRPEIAEVAEALDL